MASEGMKDPGRRDASILSRLRLIGWGAVALLLAAPLVAMQFTSEVNWTAGDFLVAGVLLGGVGLAAELSVRRSSSWLYRSGAGLGLLTGLLLVWANLAVGYIGSEDNPYNLLFFLVVAVAIAGAVLAGGRARGMALAMLAAGLVHAAIGAVGYPADTRTGPITVVMVLMWLGSAALFGASVRNERA